MLVHDSKGSLLGTQYLPLPAICVSFSLDGSLYLKSGQVVKYGLFVDYS